jgi:hypothetical protein
MFIGFIPAELPTLWPAGLGVWTRQGRAKQGPSDIAVDDFFRVALRVGTFPRKRLEPARQKSPRWRELLIPFGHSGYVALFEIDDDRTVTVTAVRHQREDDYH